MVCILVYVLVCLHCVLVLACTFCARTRVNEGACTLVGIVCVLVSVCVLVCVGCRCACTNVCVHVRVCACVCMSVLPFLIIISISGRLSRLFCIFVYCVISIV